MNMIIVHFTVSLILFQTVNSVKWKLTKHIIDLSQNYIFEGTEYNNITLLSALGKNQGQTLQIERILEFQQSRKNFIIDTIMNTNAMTILNMNSTKTFKKMMGNIEEVRYSMMKSFKKEIGLLKELNSKKNIDIEELNRIKILCKELKQEYLTFFIQLQRLEFKIYDYNEMNNVLNTVLIENLTELVLKISQNKNLPKVRLNELNVEPSLKFDNEMQIDELEKLQRLSLMIKDQLYEMAKPKDDEESEVFLNARQKTNSHNKFSKNTKVPRWLLTERDLKEIQSKYFSFKLMFEKFLHIHPSILDLKETFEKYGFTVKVFSKTFAEYYNITSIMLECVSKEDTECEEMMRHVLGEKRFEKLMEVFADLEARNIMPPL